MLNHLATQLRSWKFTGDESREELIETFEAADAAVKAQYWEFSQGMD